MAQITYRYTCGGFQVRRIDDGRTDFLVKSESFPLLAETFGWEPRGETDSDLEFNAYQWLRSQCGVKGESNLFAADPTYFDHC